MEGYDFRVFSLIMDIKEAQVEVYRVPTEEPESDGTFRWDHTDMVLVTLEAGDVKGWGYSYADTATARLVHDLLLPLIEGESVFERARLWERMVQHIRNLGRPGICSMAIAAVDNALWDLYAKVLKMPLCRLLGQLRNNIPCYASGGFTSYSPVELSNRFRAKRKEGFNMFKMKIGRDKIQDLKRIEAARDAIDDAQLFVDANGAYFAREAVSMAADFEAFDISWYEEPVTSDNLQGLRFVRHNTTAKVQVSAGEYGYDLSYFQRMLNAGAVDVLQADATRCAGITGLVKVHTLCEAHHIPLSTHCAPSLHLHPALAMKNAVHVEYFADHVSDRTNAVQGGGPSGGGPSGTRPRPLWPWTGIQI